MQALRSLALGLARAATWPLYLILLAYAARVAPWPRSLGILVSAVMTGAAIAILVHDLLRWLTGPSGWPERYLGVPRPVARQVGAAGRFMVVAAVVFLLPIYLFDHELIAPEGKPITAPALGRLLVLGYELLVWATCVRLLRGGSPLLGWISLPLSSAPDPNSADSPQSCRRDRRRRPPALLLHTFRSRRCSMRGLVWLGRRRRTGRRAGAGRHGRHHRAGRARIQLHGAPAGHGRVANRRGDRPGRGGLPRDRASHQPQRLAVDTYQPILGHGSHLGDGAACQGSLARTNARIDRRSARLGHGWRRRRR